MRGINSSSLVLLLLLFWNVIIFIYYIAKKFTRVWRVKRHNSILISFIVNALLIIFLVYFSMAIGVTRYNITDARIPDAFDGYKILQISDFHTASFYGGTESLIKSVRKEKPDVIVVTGDIVDENKVNLIPVKKLVLQLVPLAPVYFVSGNHDVWYGDFTGLKKTIKELGVNLLDNRKVILQRGSSYINLFGIGDPETWDDNSAETYLREKIKALKTDNGYNILLFHRANMFDIIKGSGIQLVFSGHMHGGQFQLPFIGGLVSPHNHNRWFPKYTDGKWTSEGTTLIVSRGLGNNAPVPRLFNPPEVVVVTLKSKV